MFRLFEYLLNMRDKNNNQIETIYVHIEFERHIIVKFIYILIEFEEEKRIIKLFIRYIECMSDEL